MKKNLRVKFLIVFIFLLFPINTKAFYNSAKSSIVMDVDSGRVLYAHNEKEKHLIASITKIMTAIVAIKKGHLDRVITVGNEVTEMYGTNIYIEVGEKIKLRDLLYGLLLRSGNDAAVTIASHVCENEKQFVEEMNLMAREIGANNTIFLNPHGLDEDTKNYSTAYDMAMISRYASKNAIYRKITGTKKYVVSTGKKTYLWYNRNKLLTYYKYCTGGKNGYTPKAGKTLVTTAEKNGLRLTVVTLNDGNQYKTHENLYNYIYKKYKQYKIIDKNSFAIDKEFVNADVYLKKSFFYPLTKEEAKYIKTIVNINNRNKKSLAIGSLNIYLRNTRIGSLTIYKKLKN